MSRVCAATCVCASAVACPETSNEKTRVCSNLIHELIMKQQTRRPHPRKAETPHTATNTHTFSPHTHAPAPHSCFADPVLLAPASRAPISVSQERTARHTSGHVVHGLAEPRQDPEPPQLITRPCHPLTRTPLSKRSPLFALGSCVCRATRLLAPTLLVGAVFVVLVSRV